MRFRKVKRILINEDNKLLKINNIMIQPRKLKKKRTYWNVFFKYAKKLAQIESRQIIL